MIIGTVQFGGTTPILDFDIGWGSGNYAEAAGNRGYKWQKHENNEGTRMDYSLASGDGKEVLYVSFPSLGPANFYGGIGDEEEVEAILKVMRTVRPTPPDR